MDYSWSYDQLHPEICIILVRGYGIMGSVTYSPQSRMMELYHFSLTPGYSKKSGRLEEILEISAGNIWKEL